MRRLAVEGGIPLIRQPIRRLNTVSTEMVGAGNAHLRACAEGKATMSGYLAGSLRGGSAVQRLEDAWAQRFGVRHAIACNSGTSALLAIYGALKPSLRRVVVPAMGMSAVASAAAFLGLRTVFADIDEHYGIAPSGVEDGDLIVAVNLFGHPATLSRLDRLCRDRGAILVEDNAQSPWATEDDVYTGTFGHAAAWSFNVHKPINAGEGGMITTNDDALAKKLHGLINHGEVNGGDYGLNLRMTELTAVLILAQIQAAEKVVASRREIAIELNMADEQPGLMLPHERRGCKSAWYCYAMLVVNRKARDWATRALIAEGVPVRAGYILIPEMAAFNAGDYENAKALNERMILLELCSIDPSKDQVEAMAEAVATIGDMA